jgi:hypothetical protein
MFVEAQLREHAIETGVRDVRHGLDCKAQGLASSKKAYGNDDVESPAFPQLFRLVIPRSEATRNLQFCSTPEELDPSPSTSLRVGMTNFFYGLG